MEQKSLLLRANNKTWINVFGGWKYLFISWLVILHNGIHVNPSHRTSQADTAKIIFLKVTLLMKYWNLNTVRGVEDRGSDHHEFRRAYIDPDRRRWQWCYYVFFLFLLSREVIFFTSLLPTLFLFKISDLFRLKKKLPSYKTCNLRLWSLFVNTVICSGILIKTVTDHE